MKIIGEIANAHGGDIQALKKLIAVAAEADVDFIKFQLYQANDLVTKNHPKYDNYCKLEFNETEWHEILAYAAGFNKPLLAETFDYASFTLSKKLNFYGYKVHSTNVQDIDFIKELAKVGKPIFLSVGGTYLQEVENAVNTILAVNPKYPLVLMNGFQSFPTPLEETNLNRFYTLKQKFNLEIGLQDHIDAEDELAYIAPFMALSMGYSYVEKHFTLDRSKKGIDYYSSLNPDELKKLVSNLKRAAQLFGNGGLDFSEKELGYRDFAKKKIVAAKELKPNTVLTKSDITFKRSPDDGGFYSDKVTHILGKKINKTITPDELILESHFA